MSARQIGLLIAFTVIVAIGITAVVPWHTRPDWRGDADLLDGDQVDPLPKTEIVPSSGLYMADGSESGPADLSLFGWLTRASGADNAPVPNTGRPSAPTPRNTGDDDASEPPVEPGFEPPTNLAPPASPEAVRAINVYLAAIAGRGDNLSVLVVNKDTGERVWVRVGETAFGYRVSYLTMKGGVLERNGRSYVLALGEGAVETARGPSTSEEEPEAEGEAPTSESAKTDEQRLIGTWKGTEPGGGDESITITFSSGGSGSISVMDESDMEAISLRWSLKGGKLELAMSMPGSPAEAEKQTISYRFESDRVLYLRDPTGGDEIRLVKQ